MNIKVRERLAVLILTLLLILPASYIVLDHEKNKKIARISEDIAYYSALNNDKNSQLTEIRNKNITLMEEVKKLYQDLLSKQPDLIAKNTVIKPVTVTTTTPATTIKKPSTTRSTKAS
jgi:hypothetical protein